MKSIYGILKGQLIALWVFGMIGWFFALDDVDSYYHSSFSPFLLWFIPFILIFYTVGCRNHKKNNLPLS